MEKKKSLKETETKLLEMFASEQWKSDDRIYSELKRDLHLDAFLKATNNNLSMLFDYLYYSNHKFGLSDVFIISFIKDNYDVNFERK